MLRRLFKRFGRPNVDALYAAVCSEARQVGYFGQPMLIPDTLDGRFELMVLITHLALRRLSNRVDGGDMGVEAREQREAAAINQALFDRLFSDMDHDLREMGMGDHGVPKQIQRMADSFFGRGQAYATALDTEHSQSQTTALALALRTNLYGTITEDTDLSTATIAMTNRIQVIVATLDARSDASVLSGAWELPALTAEKTETEA